MYLYWDLYSLNKFVRNGRASIAHLRNSKENGEKQFIPDVFSILNFILYVFAICFQPFRSASA